MAEYSLSKRVFPAPAGINRPLIANALTVIGVPRASGDKPGAQVWPQVVADVFPAPAGINRM
ncbi:hypothetical protein J1J99_000414 [Salmonella enterica subsp. enterica serovar Napoli]|nr:hypothetical protein [Salmonella enterica subsp. enterica serovar Napoli]EHG1417127.1 hypothetical protein [Salmonella enterica subsp. enterica serovar Napoli]EHG1430405.1 hypothetical protein [Salmonella enterica subsp. enterica serovar Napoli]